MMRRFLRLALLAATAITASAQSGLILRYPLTETSGTVAVDASGNGNNGIFVGGPQLNGAGGIRLDGVDDYVRLPNNIMRGLTSMTISTQALIREEQIGNYFIFGLGVSSNGIGNGYVFATGNPYRAAISPGNWATEAESRTSSNLPRDTWKTLTYVINGTSSASLYLDGALVAGRTNSNPLVTPASLGGGTTSENYIGRSLYTADRLFAGSLRDFRIYNRALTASEVATLAPTTAQRVEVALASLSVTNVGDVRGNLYLPTTSDGLTVTWSSNRASVIAADGVVHRQSADTTVTLTASIQYQGISRTRTFTAIVRKAVNLGTFGGYAFAYFTGNTIAGEKIYLAASNGNNALSWNELNGGQPILTSTLDTKGLRDPFLIRSPEGDTFYLIATDLSIGSGTSWSASVRTGSRYIEVWESHDLIMWSAQRHALVSPATAGNTWAPEAYYDNDLGAYVVFWASSLYNESDTSHSGSTYHRMMYVTTRDFVTFSKPTIWQDAGMSRIDSTVIKAGDVYFRFTKDEGASGTGCSDIIQERSTELLATLPSWTIIDTCIGRDAGTSAVEGPTTFKSNPGDVNGDKYYLFVDEYGGRGYIPLETADIAKPSWKVSSSYNLPTSPRHGTVIPVTAAELASLTATLSKTKREEVVSNRKRADGAILYYDFKSISGGRVADTSGNGHDGTIYGSAVAQSGSLIFDGVDDYVDLPDNLLAGVTDITIETEVMISSSRTTPYFIWGIGNTASSGQGNGYLFTTGDVYRTSIALGNWETEQTASSGSSLAKDTWVHLAYTLSGSTATLYLNGIQVASNTGVTNDPEDIGSGATSANYLGRSMYTSDKYLKGQMRKFAIYNRALDASEVLAISGNTAAITGVSLSNPSVLKVDPIVNGNKKTVLFPVIPGTDLTKLAPVFTTADGVTSSPASGTTVNLSSNVTYILRSNGVETARWTMKAVEMRSPVLPGLYADPNIAIFGRNYYIYATTDGYAGWGGNVFYVWKSSDLVNWSRSAKPFLTLNGTSGNVPWASGNAWAPTITERSGKYYFYFSGHNPTYNRKTIGVAVASSPEGPFTAQSTAMILNNESVTSGQAIDPCAFYDPVSGKYYLYWGNGSPVYAELADNMTSLKSGTLKAISGLTDFREGSFVVYRKGLYHMTYSIDDTGSENYRVGYATATSAAGPWTYRGVVLQKDPDQGIMATGHNSIVNVPGTDDWYIAYHRFAIPGGDGTHRETTIDRLYFDDSTGFIKTVVPTLSSVGPETVPAARLSRVFRG